MFPLLRVALRIQDMLILLAIGCVLLGVVYLIDQFRAELKKSGVEKTNFTPWQAPHFHFLMMALMVGISGVFMPAEQTLDLQLHDTYFVVSLPVIGVLAAAYLLFVSFVYFMARRLSLLKWMAVLHLVLTAVIGWAFYKFYLDFPEPDVIFATSPYSTLRMPSEVVGLFVVVLALVQVLLPLNLLVGLWRRR